MRAKQADSGHEPLASTDLPDGFDGIDLAELLDVIDELMHWLRVGTFEEEEGEREVRDRAGRIRDRYRLAT
jgi:hypothetical protein